jgi:hypothetical protein
MYSKDEVFTYFQDGNVFDIARGDRHDKNKNLSTILKLFKDSTIQKASVVQGYRQSLTHPSGCKLFYLNYGTGEFGFFIIYGDQIESHFGRQVIDSLRHGTHK